jgi:ATP-dependent RNA helicase SUPV3L1/SUV3
MNNKLIKYIQIFSLDFFLKQNFKIKEEIILNNENLEDYEQSFHLEKIFLYLKNKEYHYVVPNLYVLKNNKVDLNLSKEEAVKKFKIFISSRKKYKKKSNSIPHQFQEKNEELNRLLMELTEPFAVAEYLIQLIKDKQSILTKYTKKQKKDLSIEYKEQEVNIEKEWKDSIKSYHELFPVARKIKRKIKLFIGPTNSGKTYNALNELVSHGSGVYLAPLRLLALEGKEEIEQRGQFCSFITGEEREIVKDAKFIAQTIETFNYNKIVHSVLIDEVQLISDPSRGWAWSQALIGAPAENIILTGSLDCLGIIEYVCRLLGDELEVVQLTRHTNLEIKETPVSSLDFSKLEENSAIIVFSRKSVLHYKHILEKQNLAVSIIYGNLSPDVRREEAKKFREGKTKYLISTDAIAMGLNLPIKQIIFAEIEKFNGEDQVELGSNDVRQIAGRAGRYKKFDVGYVSSFSSSNLNFIRKKMKEENVIQNILYIRPTWEQIDFLSQLYDNQSLSFLLKSFYKLTQKNSDIYICGDLKQVIELATSLDQKPLSLKEKFEWSLVPIDTTNPAGLVVFNNWINSVISGKTIKAEAFYKIPLDLNHFDADYLYQAEINVKLLTAYSWLAYHKTDVAPDLEICQGLKNEYNNFIIKVLQYKITHKKCKQCDKKLKMEYQYNICQSCYENN